jgi:hypothetical protein
LRHPAGRELKHIPDGGACVDFRFTPQQEQFRAEVREFMRAEWMPYAEESE